MSRTFVVPSVTTELVVELCYSCSVPFGIPREFLRQRKTDGATFYCPNGHGQVYAETDAMRLQKKLDLAEQRALSLRAEADQAWARADEEMNAAAQARRQHGATKGVLTKTRRRIANGVCPCCHRTFVSLARHMKTKHPEYIEEADQAVSA